MGGAEVRTTLSARPLPPYGDGVTYWPLAEMLKSAGVLDSDEASTVMAKLRRG